MGLVYFFFGVIAGMLLLVILPLFIALVGVLFAIGVVIALPLILVILAILILIGIVAAAPALGYGLLLAAILIALWASDRKRRPRDKPLSL